MPDYLASVLFPFQHCGGKLHVEIWGISLIKALVATRNKYRSS